MITSRDDQSGARMQLQSVSQRLSVFRVFGEFCEQLDFDGTEERL
jgi:hypothetical protein